MEACPSPRPAHRLPLLAPPDWTATNLAFPTQFNQASMFWNGRRDFQR